MNTDNIENYHYTAQSDVGQLKHIRNFISTKLYEKAYDDSLVHKLVLAVDEVCSNVMRHNIHPEHRKIDIDLIINASSIEVDIMNTGNEFDSKSNTATSVHALVEKSKKGGLGLMLIHKIVDQVEFLHKDNMNICKILMSVKK